MRALLLAAVLLAAPAAQASPQAEAFIKTCGELGADFAAVSAALAAPPWRAAEINAPSMGGVKITQTADSVAVIGVSKVTAQAWSGENQEHIRVSACTFRLGAVAYVGVAKDIQAWVGTPPQSGGEAKSGWLYTLDASGARTRTAMEAAKADVAGAGLFILTVSANGLDTIIDLLKIKS